MLKKTITYTDYNGVERTEDFYFNLTKAELMEMEASVSGGLTETIKNIAQTQNGPELMKLFKGIVLKSYGEKDLDGKRFKKSAELSDAFSQTEAYSELFMEVFSSDEAMTNFIKGILPADLMKQAEQNELRELVAGK